MIELRKRTSPGPSTANYGALYVSSADNKLHYVDENGNDIAVGLSTFDIGNMGGKFALSDAFDLESGVSGADTVYYFPYSGNIIHLMDDNSVWHRLTFSTMSQETWIELTISTVNGANTVTIQDTSRVSVGMAVWVDGVIDTIITEITSPTEFTVADAALSTATETGEIYLYGDSLFDAYLYLDYAGTPRFGFKQWTSDRNRGFDIIRQEGIECVEVGQNRCIGILFNDDVGSALSTSQFRHILSLYNQAKLGCSKADATNYTAPGAVATRMYRGSGSNLVELVSWGGWYDVSVYSNLKPDGGVATVQIGIGINTTSSMTVYVQNSNAEWIVTGATKSVYLDPGINYIYILEYVSAVGSRIAMAGINVEFRG